jgi:hypothetical protein
MLSKLQQPSGATVRSGSQVTERMSDGEHLLTAGDQRSMIRQPPRTAPPAKAGERQDLGAAP